MDLYGVWPGIVVNTQDPLRRGRIRVRVPQVFGDTTESYFVPDEQLPWAFPCFPLVGKDSGLAMIPEVGSGVWVTFYGNDARTPVWLGGWFAANDKITEHEISYRPAPEDYVLKTPGGHLLQLSDAAVSFIKLQEGKSAQNLKFTQTEYALTCLRSNTMVQLDKNVNTGTTLTYNAGTNIAMNSGQNFSMVAGQALSISALLLTISSLTTLSLATIGAANLSVGAALTITALGIIQILAGTVTVGIVMSAQKLLNKTMMDLFNSHTHNYNPGPGGPTPTSVPITLAQENVHTTQNLQGS